MEGYQPFRKKIYEYLRIEKPRLTDIEEITAAKAKMFESLNSDDDLLFFAGVHNALYLLDDVLTDEDKEKIRNIVIKKRRLFRKPIEYRKEIFIFIGDWAELCEMLDIEMTGEEIEIFRKSIDLSSEDIKTMMEQIKRAVKTVIKDQGYN